MCVRKNLLNVGKFHWGMCFDEVSSSFSTANKLSAAMCGARAQGSCSNHNTPDAHTQRFAHMHLPTICVHICEVCMYAKVFVNTTHNGMASQGHTAVRIRRCVDVHMHMLAPGD